MRELSPSRPTIVEAPIDKSSGGVNPAANRREGQLKTEDHPIVASMKEIGAIVARRGTYSVYESYSGRLDTHGKSISLPIADGTKLEASVSFPANERSLAGAVIKIRTVGPAPSHYKKSDALRRSVTSIAKKPWDRDNSIGVTVNKFFYPDAKSFEKQQPAQTEPERICEKYSPVTEYKNIDGEDYVKVYGPIGRLGEKTLAFSEEFVNEALEYLRKYDETQPVVESQTLELPEPLQS